MTTLTVTSRGQVTLRKDVLRHLGIEPGQKIEIDKLPDGQLTLRAARPKGKLSNFVGILKGKSSKVPTLEELTEAAAECWAGER